MQAPDRMASTLYSPAGSYVSPCICETEKVIILFQASWICFWLTNRHKLLFHTKGVAGKCSAACPWMTKSHFLCSGLIPGLYQPGLCWTTHKPQWRYKTPEKQERDISFLAPCAVVWGPIPPSLLPLLGGLELVLAPAIFIIFSSIIYA